MSQDDGLYARQALVGWWSQKRLSGAHGLVFGAGAIGNEVVKNLALAGIGRITCIDFDTVEPSNASRCVFFDSHAVSAGPILKVDAIKMGLARLPHACDFEGKGDDIVEWSRRDPDGLVELAKSADVIIVGLDNWEAKLAANAASFWAGTPLVAAGMEEFSGGVFVSFPPETACLECLLPAYAKEEELKRAYSCTRTDPVKENVRIPTNIATTSMIAAAAVLQALLIIHGGKNGTGNQARPDGVPKPLRGEQWNFYSLVAETSRVEFPVANHCELHKWLKVSRKRPKASISVAASPTEG